MTLICSLDEVSLAVFQQCFLHNLSRPPSSRFSGDMDTAGVITKTSSEATTPLLLAPNLMGPGSSRTMNRMREGSIADFSLFSKHTQPW